jgi:foldase protein PrsA
MSPPTCVDGWICEGPEGAVSLRHSYEDAAILLTRRLATTSSEVLVIRRVIVAVFVLVLAVSAGIVEGCGGGVSGDAVAKIGDVEISESALNQRAGEFAKQYGIADEATDPEGWAVFKSQVLDYLITYQCAAQKAESLGVAVTDAEVQTEIDTILTDTYQGDQAAFDKDLTAAGMTTESLKANYKENMLLQKVYEKVTASVTEVPAEEIAAYYEENKDTYFVDETRTARHILIKPGGEETNSSTTTTTAAGATTTTTVLTDADWAAALATADKVRGLLTAGGDWTELAAKYSDDGGTSTKGGDLGDISKGVMVEEFEDAVFSLAIDEISQPVKTTFGYHVIQVTAINEAKQQTLEEVSDTIKTTLLGTKQQEAWDKWVEETKSELKVTYREGMEPTTTTESTTTTLAADTTTTAAGQTITTAAATTTTAKP